MTTAIARGDEIEEDVGAESICTTSPFSSQQRAEPANSAIRNACVEEGPAKESVKKGKQGPRLIHRNLPFHQSRNIVHVSNGTGKNWWSLFRLYQQDWFHVFLRLNTWVSVTILLLIWTAQMLIFALIYVEVDNQNPNIDCGLGVVTGVPINFTGAFAFSLETSTTVGYTLPGSSMAFFQNCPYLQVTIYFQMAFCMMFNAFLFAFFYNRIARCEARATLVIFSNKAVMRIDSTGKMVLEIQVYDSDSKHPVVEAHVRLYIVHGEIENTPDPSFPQLRDTPSFVKRSENYIPLRLFRPNDEFNSPLFTSIPSRVIHHVDSYSPLMPPQYKDETILPTFGLPLRELDSWTGNREGYPCTICGETYGTHERLWKHIRYNQLMEQSCNMSGVGTHLSLGSNMDDEETKPKIPTFEHIREFWLQTGAELVAIVEGIDPLTSGTFQALQSYQVEDVVFGAKFSPCFTNNNLVDFDLFHKTVDQVQEKKNN